MREQDIDAHWKDRRVLAGVLAFGIVSFPIACAVGLTVLLEEHIERPVTAFPLAMWCLAIVVVATAVFLCAERFARRAVPLRVLLRMGLAFPGRPPKRLAVAWRAASVRDLDRRVEDARTHGIADEPTVAAERIVTLAAAMSTHDRATRGHSERVRALTDMISDELRLGAADRDRLRWSALLHDVGKLAVHPEVLNKQGTLSADEWELIRLHPLEGAKLTEPLAGWLGAWASTIAEHHERFDGKGYPAGLAGRSISAGGRIVAVADAYDVMTAVRSYKKAVGPDEARRELAACAGTQFDPEVVRAFLAVSIWRLRIAMPLSWLGALGFARVGSVARLGAAAGQSLATGLAAAGAVAALALGAPVSHPRPPTGPVAQGTGSPAGAVPGTGVPGTGTPGEGTPGGGMPGVGTPGPGTGTQAPDPGSSSTPTTGTLPSGGAQPTSTTTTAIGGRGDPTTTQPPPSGSSSTTTTTQAGSPSTTTPTTLPGTPSTTTSSVPTTTTTAPTTTTTVPTTTTTTVPSSGLPAPPTALKATGGCQLLVIGPEITLDWTSSTSGSVSSYTVLRSTNGTSYSAITAVTASTTSYKDTSVGMGATYWYEVEAVAPSGTSTSSAVSATTPPLCLRL